MYNGCEAENREGTGGGNMPKTSEKSTKSKIVSAAWKLFYERGYDGTTVEEIIFESGTSKGSFYHYFSGKDALLGSLADLFDQKYIELEPRLAQMDGCIEKLLFLNGELFDMIENTVDLDLIKRMYATQLTAKGEKTLVDHNRVYFRLLRRLVAAGQASGELTDKLSSGDIVKYYAFCERAMIYDWCLCGGENSLKQSAAALMPFLMKRIEA